MKKPIIYTVALLSATYYYLEQPNIGIYILTLVCFLSIIYIFGLKLKSILVSFLVSIAFFLGMSDDAFDRQARKILHPTFDSKYVPSSLDDIMFEPLDTYTPLFDKYYFSSEAKYCKEFWVYVGYKNIWGYEYYYEDKSGDFELVKTPFQESKLKD
jgi:hypothetical protein